MSDIAPSPVKSLDRISSLDVIRGAALLGILMMNIVAFGLPYAYENPNNAGGADGLNFLTWQVTSLFFEGTMRGLFSMLFGAGIVLMTGRAEARDPSIAVADVYFRRNLWLVAFGLVHAWLLLFPRRYSVPLRHHRPVPVYLSQAIAKNSDRPRRPRAGDHHDERYLLAHSG